MLDHFARPELANRLADQLMGLVPGSDAPNGLFLAAPRRTGKSEFLVQDLARELRSRGVLVVYVDLWSDKRRSPMELMAAGLAKAVEESLGFVGATAKKSGLKKFAIPGTGLEFDASKIGAVDGLTLPQALMVLRAQTQKPIALIIDEAQHALVSQEGEAAMSALKSARDQMRDIYAPKGEPGLLLVMSGSHRDKLMRLLDTAATPFWGSQVLRLPTLGSPYLAHVAQQLRASHPALLSLKGTDLQAAFEACGEAPQALKKIYRAAMKWDLELDAGSLPPPWQGDANSFAVEVARLAREFRDHQYRDIENTYEVLQPLHKAVIQRLLEQGKGFKPYDAQALKFYELQVGKKITPASVQKALDGLIQTDPPLVWRSLRGEYAAYDQDWDRWYQHRRVVGHWPPRKQK